jgi:hypothetical protein
MMDHEDAIDRALCLIGQMLAHYRDRHHRSPHAIVMRPSVYRAWREAGGTDCVDGVPVRITERMPPDVMVYAPAGQAWTW